MAVGAGRILRVGRYLVDLECRRLSKDGLPVALGFRPFEALRILVDARGQVVPKERFFQQIWPDQIVDESSLTQCIAQLRKALLEGAPGEGYVETVPRIGYRLAALVEPGEELTPNHGRNRLGRWRLAWVVAGIALAAGLTVWSLWGRQQRKAEAKAIHKEGQRLGRQRDLNRAVDAYRRAIHLDPSNAEYHASLAQTLTKFLPYSGIDPNVMREAAERAVALDPACSGCKAVLGFILFSRFWEWTRAEQYLREAAAGNTRESGIRGYLAMLLATQGRLEEALREADDGLRRDPYHASLHTIRAGILYFAKRYPEAAAAAGRAASFAESQPTAWDWRAYSLALQGNFAEVFNVIAASGAESYPPDVSEVFRKQGLGAAVQRICQTTLTLKSPDYRTYRRAHWRMLAGDETGALDELETAHRVRVFDIVYIAVDPMFEPLRDNPRFHRILRDMDLPQAVRAQSAR